MCSAYKHNLYQSETKHYIGSSYRYRQIHVGLVPCPKLALAGLCELAGTHTHQHNSHLHTQYNQCVMDGNFKD